MASRAASNEMPLNDPTLTEAWLRTFAALSRHKKLKDGEGADEDEHHVTDFFLAQAGLEAVRQVSLMVAPAELETMKFVEIKKAIMERIQPKKRLIVAERTRFLSLKQTMGESATNYVQRLREAAKYCEFNKLNTTEANQSAEDELIQMRLIDGLASNDHKVKVLEQLQTSETVPSLGGCVAFIQQLEMIHNFGKTDSNLDDRRSETQLDVAHVDRNSEQQKIRNCKYCGKSHLRLQCPAYGKTCSACKRRNHFAKVCRNKTTQHLKQDSPKDDDSDTDSHVYMVKTTAMPRTNTQKKTVTKTVTINDVKLEMQLDSGSDTTLIPQNFWRRLGKPKLSKSNIRLRQFDGSQIQTMGYFEGLLDYEGKYSPVIVNVAVCEKSHGLLGTDIMNFHVDSFSIHTCKEEPTLGCLKGYEAKIVVRDDAQPCFYESRPLPIHVKPKVVEKLQQMIKAGVLEEVPPGGSKWASPMVVITKPNGDLRICTDYKVGVNRRICCDSYPMPSMETAFSELAGMKVYARLDLANAYHQIKMDRASQEITTMNTPIGLLRWTRLPFGIKTASAQFQAAMEKAIGSVVDGIVIYQDDICIGAVSFLELEQKLQKVMLKLEELGMVINRDKCVFKANEITFLGHRISQDGVRPDEKLVEKVKKIQPPKNRKELNTFIGMVNYYGRYVKKFSELVEPLSELRAQNVVFRWGRRQQDAFEELKSRLTKYPVIKVFDPKAETVLTTDASEVSISAILSQNGHPFLYLSRRLTPAESRYSNIEREALSIVWATNRARLFLLGKKFLLQSDHRPLEFIFNPGREIPKVTSARLLRWALQLSAYDYDICYVKGDSIPHVDALTRLQFDDEPEDHDVESSFIHWTQTDVLSIAELEIESNRDPVLSAIMDRVTRNRWSNCSVAERPFKSVRQRLSVESGVLCNGDLLVPPPTLRKKILEAAHGDIHCGVIATRNRLRREAWWPGYCQDVEQYVNRCAKCKEIKPIQQKSLHTWPVETEPWSRVHMDHGNVPGLGLFLILVDAATGWPEAVRVRDRSAKTVMTVLRTIFARNGVPKCLVSDNAAEFGDANLCRWLTKIGCRPLKTPSYHPASNGAVERMVQSIKRGIRAFSEDKGSFDAFLCRLLLSYRCVPHAGRDASPSELMGRQLRSPLTMSFMTDGPLWYVKTPGAEPESARFLMQSGSNTAIVVREGERPTLVHRDQIEVAPEQTDTLENPENEALPADVPIPETSPPVVRVSTRFNKGVPPQRFQSVSWLEEM